MMSFKMKSAIIAVALTATSSSAFAAEKCELALRGQNAAYTREAGWRAGSTHEVATAIVLTNRPREQKIQRLKADMSQTTLNNATPVLRVVESSGVSLNMTQQAHYKNGLYAKYDVATGGEPVLRATLLLPVSGHTGPADAQAWAKSDTYSVWAEVNGKQIYLAKDVKSLDLVTVQEVAIPLVKDTEVQVYYERSGNSVGGFVAGRVLGFTWTGN